MEPFKSLDSYKNKEAKAQSAVASREVREHLAGFLSKRLSASQLNNSTTTTSTTTTTSSSSTAQLLASSSYRRQQSSSSALGGPSSNAHDTSSPSSANTFCRSGAGSQDDDHPLRKTASMPTMHIPYKAQSISRRHQMERRITMSPLMRHKSRPKRQLINSLDSNHDYSSNPCIISLGRSNNSSNNSTDNPVRVGSTDNQTLTNSSGQQSMLFCKQDSAQETSYRAGLTGQDHLEPSELALRQQQHAKVNEAILKTVSQRASSKIRLAGAGGSLDTAMATPTADISASQGAVLHEQVPFGGGLARGHLAHSRVSSKPEPRQWSLDGASSSSGDPLASSAFSHLRNQKKSNSGTCMFPEMRLAVTNEAAQLRRSQSPSCSISMGLSLQMGAIANQTAPMEARMGPMQAAHQQQQQQQQMKLQMRPNLAHHPLAKLHSSSSSSTSSLLSTQSSLEDSASGQAIDLSHAGEAGRQQRILQQQQHHHQVASRMNRTGSVATPCGAALGLQIGRNAPILGQHYHHALQESFTQLQLCQPQPPSDSMEQLMMSNQHQRQQLYQHAFGGLRDLNSAKVQASSFDTATANTENFAAGRDLLAERLNLATTFQNSMVLQDIAGNFLVPQQQHTPEMAAAASQSWQALQVQLLASAGQDPSLAQSPTSSALLASLPEQHRINLLAQVMQQQQSALGQLPVQPQLVTTTDERHRSATNLIMSRALSSPLLVPAARLCSTSAAMQQLQQAGTSKHFVNQIQVKPMTGSGDVELTQQAQRVGALNAIQKSSQDESIRGIRKSTDNNRGDEIDDDDEVIVEDAEMDTAVATNSNPTGKSALNSLDLSLSSARLAESQLYQKHLHQQPPLDQPKKEGSVFYVDPLDPAASIASAATEASKASCRYLFDPGFGKSSTTGLIYELALCNHKCVCANEDKHPENSLRVLGIWCRLFHKGLLPRCVRIEGRQATQEELQLCHSETYATYFGKSPYERIKLNKLDLTKLPIEGLTQLECGGQGADIDTAWNEELTPVVARLAVGCVIEAAVSVARGKLINAFAIVRPPGHHAEYQQAMGFCFFNSIAIATRVLIEEHHLPRILIVDWDVHHGNGIQRCFYEDKRVMYISLHRHDKGKFFPGTGGPHELGSGLAEGYNINIAWFGESMGDAEYMAAFRSIVMPIAREFEPSMVLVASGFDAAQGHSFNFGGYNLTPACYAFMTRQLMSLADNRLVLSLEGGYKLESVFDCAESCVRALLGDLPTEPMDQISESELSRVPNRSACETLLEISNLTVKFWPGIEKYRSTINMSALDAAQ